MAYRFTNTEKWSDSWFSSLSLTEKILFIYLCENCDCAGFIELNFRRIAADINTSQKDIEAACKGLARGLIFSKDGNCCYIVNFLKHQKNLPLNGHNKAHIGILKRFDLYSQKFEIQNVNDFIEGACKGLQSPIGIGNGIGIGNSINNNGDFPKKNTDEVTANTPPQFNFLKSLIEIGVEEQVAKDWLIVRKAKKGANTETAFNALVKQIEISKQPANECIILAVSKNWCGFDAEWAKKEHSNKPASATGNWGNYKSGTKYEQW